MAGSVSHQVVVRASAATVRERLGRRVHADVAALELGGDWVPFEYLAGVPGALRAGWWRRGRSCGPGSLEVVDTGATGALVTVTLRARGRWSGGPRLADAVALADVVQRLVRDGCREAGAPVVSVASPALRSGGAAAVVAATT